MICHCGVKDPPDGHCPCVIGHAKYSFLDKSDPERIVTYTVPMLTYCNGSVSMDE